MTTLKLKTPTKLCSSALVEALRLIRTDKPVLVIHSSSAQIAQYLADMYSLTVVEADDLLKYKNSWMIVDTFTGDAVMSGMFGDMD